MTPVKHNKFRSYLYFLTKEGELNYRETTKDAFERKSNATTIQTTTKGRSTTETIATHSDYGNL